MERPAKAERPWIRLVAVDLEVSSDLPFAMATTFATAAAPPLALLLTNLALVRSAFAGAGPVRGAGGRGEARALRHLVRRGDPSAGRGSLSEETSGGSAQHRSIFVHARARALMRP